MKIDSTIKRRELPEHFKEHLSFTYPGSIKSSIVIVTYIMLDLLIILPILYPYHTLTVWITMPLLFIVNIWALSMLIRKVESLQFEFILFLGTVGAVGSICYFVLIQKTAYINLNIQSPYFLIISIIMFLSFLYFQVWFHNKKYTSLNSNFGKFKNLPWHYKLLAIAPPAGYIIGQYFMNKSQMAISSLMIIVYVILSTFFTYMSVKFIHRYLFMKANMHLLKTAYLKTKIKENPGGAKRV